MTTQELIGRALDHVNREIMHPKVRDTLRQAAARLSELSAELQAAERLIMEYLTVIARQAAELDALRGKLAGVDEKALEVAAKRLCMKENGGDHLQNHCIIAASWLVSAEHYRAKAHAAIAAYLAAVGG